MQRKQQRKFLMPEQPKETPRLTHETVEEYIRAFNARTTNPRYMAISNIDTKISRLMALNYGKYTKTPAGTLARMLDPALANSYMSRYLFGLTYRLEGLRRKFDISSDSFWPFIGDNKGTDVDDDSSDVDSGVWEEHSDDERSDERPRSTEIPIEMRDWTLVNSVSTSVINPSILEILKNPVGTTVLSGGCVVNILRQSLGLGTRVNGDYDIYTNNPDLHKMCDKEIVKALSKEDFYEFDASRINFQIFLYNYLNEHFNDESPREFLFDDGTSLQFPPNMREVPLEELLNMTDQRVGSGIFDSVVQVLSPEDEEARLRDLFRKTKLNSKLKKVVLEYINMYNGTSTIPNTSLDHWEGKSVGSSFDFFNRLEYRQLHWSSSKSIPFMKARFVGNISRINLAEFKQHIKYNISLYWFKMLLLPFEPSVSAYGYVKRYKHINYRIRVPDSDEEVPYCYSLTSTKTISGTGPLGGIFNLDIDFIDVTYPGLEKRFDNPQDFIKVEFDFDIVKNYAIYNPRTKKLDLYSLYPELWIGGSLPCFNLSFHKDMTINTHKRKTTIGRIVKYQRYGYKYIGPVLRLGATSRNPTGLIYKTPFIDLESLTHPFTQEEIDIYLCCLRAHPVELRGRFDLYESLTSESATESQKYNLPDMYYGLRRNNAYETEIGVDFARDEIIKARFINIHLDYVTFRDVCPGSVLPDGKLICKRIPRYFYEDLKAVFDMYKSDPKRGAKYMIHFSNELGLNMFGIFPKTLYASTLTDLENRGLNAINFATSIVADPSINPEIWEMRRPFLDIALREITEGIYDENVHRIPFYIPEVDRLARVPVRVKIDNDQIAWDTA
jgi:hypothetical protein